jgi:lactoylglutathione lyase
MADSANVRHAVPFFMVEDMDRSVRWYVDGLGAVITHRWEPDGKLRWCWLQIGDAALMLQEYAKGGHGGSRPAGPVGLGVSVCFMCDDAIAIYREVTARGLEARRPFVGNRLWVTMLVDPDGYHVDFESPTDAPEETEWEGD